MDDAHDRAGGPARHSVRARRIHGSATIAGVALAIAGYGVAFGVLARDAGLAAPTVLAMSALAYSGGAQAAFVATLVAATPSAAVTAALLVNLRLALYGAMASRILSTSTTPRRLVGLHLATDETIALSSMAARQDRVWTYWASGLTFFVVWTPSTLAGVAVGDVVTDPAALGLDVAFPAVFVALLYPLLKRRRALIAAVAAALTTAVATPLAPAGLPMLFAIAAAAACLAVWRRAARADVP